MRKFALIVRAGNSEGKYYNDYRDGSVLLFDDYRKAEQHAIKVEEGSSKNIWVEVVEYDENLKLDGLLSLDFVEKYGKKKRENKMKPEKEFGFIKNKEIKEVYIRNQAEIITLEFKDGTFANIYNTSDVERDGLCLTIKEDFLLKKYFNER